MDVKPARFNKKVLFRNSLVAMFWHDWRALRFQAERVLFARLREACHSGDPRAALSSLTLWLGCCFEESEFPSIEEFADQFHDDDLQAQLESLRGAVEELQPDWRGHELYRAAGRVRGTLQAKVARSDSPPFTADT